MVVGSRVIPISCKAPGLYWLGDVGEIVDCHRLGNLIGLLVNFGLIKRLSLSSTVAIVQTEALVVISTKQFQYGELNGAEL